MGIRLYPKAGYKEIALFLGYSADDIRRYEETEKEEFEEGTADEKSAILNSISYFGFGKFDIRLLEEAGLEIDGGSSEDAEFAVKLLLTTRFYDPLKEDAFVWAAFFKRTGGVSWC